MNAKLIIFQDKKEIRLSNNVQFFAAQDEEQEDFIERVEAVVERDYVESLEITTIEEKNFRKTPAAQLQKYYADATGLEAELLASILEEKGVSLENFKTEKPIKEKVVKEETEKPIKEKVVKEETEPVVKEKVVKEETEPVVKEKKIIVNTTIAEARAKAKEIIADAKTKAQEDINKAIEKANDLVAKAQSSIAKARAQEAVVKEAQYNKRDDFYKQLNMFEDNTD